MEKRNERHGRIRRIEREPNMKLTSKQKKTRKEDRKSKGGKEGTAETDRNRETEILTGRKRPTGSNAAPINQGKHRHQTETNKPKQ